MRRPSCSRFLSAGNYSLLGVRHGRQETVGIPRRAFPGRIRRHKQFADCCRSSYNPYDQDHDVDSFFIAIDADTGKPLWKTPRPDAVRSYSTPILWSHDGRRELLVRQARWSWPVTILPTAKKSGGSTASPESKFPLQYRSATRFIWHHGRPAVTQSAASRSIHGTWPCPNGTRTTTENFPATRSKTTRCRTAFSGWI